MSKELSARIKNKIDTSSNWAANNPVLLNGEFGIESDTKKMKVGDGSSRWNDLTYISGEGGAAILYTTEEALEDEANLEADTYYATDDDEDINLSTAEAIQQEIAQKTKRYLTESWSLEDGSQWYNVYNDGWKECGGHYPKVSSDGYYRITLPISFSNTNYQCLKTCNHEYDSNITGRNFTTWGKTVDSFATYQASGGSNTASNTGFDYLCFGY